MNERPDRRFYNLERELLSSGHRYICGVDEAGRGCLSGPVVSAACILNPENIPEGITDSKKLSPEKREIIYKRIISSSIDWSIGISNNEEIDSENILNATIISMKRAVESLDKKPDIILVDAVNIKGLNILQKSYIKGDEEIISIGAASILAKVTRDRIMLECDRLYPGYNWKQNKGYPTREHKEAIIKYGLTEYHRKSFKWTFN